MKTLIIELLALVLTVTGAVAQQLGKVRLKQPTFVVDREQPSLYAQDKTITYYDDGSQACKVFGPFVAQWIEPYASPKPLLIKHRISRLSVPLWTGCGFKLDPFALKALAVK